MLLCKASQGAGVKPRVSDALAWARAFRPLSPCAQAHDASAPAAGVYPGRTASSASPWWGAIASILP